MNAMYCIFQTYLLVLILQDLFRARHLLFYSQESSMNTTEKKLPFNCGEEHTYTLAISEWLNPIVQHRGWKTLSHLKPKTPVSQMFQNPTHQTWSPTWKGGHLKNAWRFKDWKTLAQKNPLVYMKSSNFSLPDNISATPCTINSQPRVLVQNKHASSLLQWYITPA